MALFLCFRLEGGYYRFKTLGCFERSKEAWHPKNQVRVWKLRSTQTLTSPGYAIPKKCRSVDLGHFDGNAVRSQTAIPMRDAAMYLYEGVRCRLNGKSSGGWSRRGEYSAHTGWVSIMEEVS